MATSVACCFPSSEADAKNSDSLDAIIHANRPYIVTFDPQRATFVRIVIQHSSHSQPCIDELEVYGPGSEINLALAAHGAQATASSCLPGYAIHQIGHLNDGRYGNAHSWIAAGTSNEWAQVELAKEAEVAGVVISRDRDGKYQDRVPVAFEIRLSSNGRDWRTVCRVQATAAVEPRQTPGYTGPFRLPPQPTWEQLLRYAFDCERYTWERMSADDHLSPLKTDRPALPGGEPYSSRIARLDPLSRTLVQMDQMI